MKRFIPTLRLRGGEDLQWYLLLLDDGSFGIDWLGVSHANPDPDLWDSVRSDSDEHAAVIASWPICTTWCRTPFNQRLR